MIQKQSSAKRASTIAITAALYTVFFFLSYSITLPNFTLLYLPIILLGVFPIWFGWSGLVGCMIGAFIGGAFVEGLGFLGVFEAVCALIIYLINWLLIPKGAAEGNSKKQTRWNDGGISCQFSCRYKLHTLPIHHNAATIPNHRCIRNLATDIHA